VGDAALHQAPLLRFTSGRKFHVRAYVLAMGSLRVYLWSDMLALVAVERYDRDSDSRNAHITNTCANAAHKDFVEEENVRLLSEALPPAMLSRAVESMRGTVPRPLPGAPCGTERCSWRCRQLSRSSGWTSFSTKREHPGCSRRTPRRTS